jgi:hypothetical protein
MDQLAKDLATGKIKLHEADKKPEKPTGAVKEKSRLAVLMKTHDEQCQRHNRAAQEAQQLAKYHKERGEHELANTVKELIKPLQQAATIHKRLHALYKGRHGEEG